MSVRTTAFTLIGAFVALTACSDDPTDPGPTVSVTPSTTTVQVGGTLTLNSTVSASADSAVIWTVDCGEIAANGTSATFTAPWGPRSCQATATSVANPTVAGVAEITVTPVPAQDNLLSPAGFDSGFSPFDGAVRTPPVVEWTSDDARGNPTSGAVLMHHFFAGNNGTLIALDFCFTPEPGAEYRAGGSARFLNVNPATFMNMGARVYEDGCEDFDVFLNNIEIPGSTTEWTSGSFTFTAPAGSTKPIRVSLGLLKETGNDVDTSALVDDLFLIRIN